ncbi:unnamed protein product [Ixodes hexagonus]
MKHIHDYGRANFSSINLALSKFLDDYLPGFLERSVESNWFLFKNCVAMLIETYIPSKKIRCNTNAPWVNANLRRLRNRKKRLFRAAKRLSSGARWTAYHNGNRKYTATLSATKSHFLNYTLPTMLANNPKQFWSIVNPNIQSSIVLHSFDGVDIPVCESATVLNDAFSMSFTASDVNHLPALPVPTFLPMDPVTIDAIGVAGVINNMKLSSCAGIDGINTKFLKIVTCIVP